MHFMFDSCKVIQDAQYRAVAKFFVMGGGGGIIASAEGMSLTGGSGGIFPQKRLKFGGYEMVFSTLFIRYVSKKLTSNNCEKAGVFSAYKSLFPRSC